MSALDETYEDLKALYASDKLTEKESLIVAEAGIRLADLLNEADQFLSGIRNHFAERDCEAHGTVVSEPVIEVIRFGMYL